MPPRVSREAAASDSESRAGHSNTGGNSNSRASTKARNAAAQAATAELLAKHIHSNGPQDKKPVDPLDFDQLSTEELRRYKAHYQLPIKTSMTMPGYLIGSSTGKKTYSFKHKDRVSKHELSGAVKKHFMAQPVKESEIITNFLYKVNNQDKSFKLNFK